MKSFINFLPPWVETNIQPAFYDKESGSVLQQTARMYAKVNQLVRCFNNLSKETKETIDEYIAKFVELKDYVDTYFENLDVQEEINNKLDEMSESGELERIITEYYQGYIKLIFPNYGADGVDTLGDCSIIQNGDKSLMIDTFTGTEGQPECYQSIREALYNANITTLDYLIITHYHGDHIGNVLNLLSDGYLAGCTVYLPRTVTISGVTYDGGFIKTALTNAGVTWIEINNQLITVGDDLNVQMLNGSAEDYQYYEDLAESDTSYNNAYNDRSIVCDIEYKGRHLLFTGDLEYRGCDYIADKLSASSYDFLKDCHHGYIANAPDFCARVNPDYVLIPASAGMVNKNFSQWEVNSAYWVRKSKNVAIQGYQPQEAIFKVDILGVKPYNEIYFVNELSCHGNTVYYVDYNSADKIRTGSTEHPFKTLNEAMVFLQKNNPEEIVVAIRSLPISNNKLYISGFKNIQLSFKNNVTYNNDILIENCNRVLINNLKQVTGKTEINNSEVELVNYSNTSGGNSLNIFSSKVAFTGTLTLNIGNENGIIARYESELSFATNNNGITLTFAENHTGRLLDAYYASIYFNSYAITYLSSFPFKGKLSNANTLNTCYFSNNATNLLTLYYNDETTYTGGDLKEDYTNYQVFLVDYADSDGYRKIEKISRWNNNTLTTIRSNTAGTETYVKSATIKFNGSTFSIINSKQTILKHNASTEIQTGNFIRIFRIIGQPGAV